MTPGRHVKFTPERLDQIRNLVERGESREQIAELISCTVGSLQVTRSHHRISLRQVRLNNGMTPKLAIANSNGPRNDPPPQPPDGAQRTPPPEQPAFTLRIVYRGRTIDVRLPVSAKVLTNLAIVAALHDRPISELLAEIISEAMEKL